MSNELHVTYVGSSTPYALIRLTNGRAWNGSAFEVFSNANIATYDVALTSRGGDYWSGDFPSSVSTNTTVIIQYYLSTGTPAITDYALPQGGMYVWDGSALVTSTTTAEATTVSSSYQSNTYVFTGIPTTGQQVSFPLSYFQALVVEALQVVSASAAVGGSTTTITLGDHATTPTSTIAVSLGASDTSTAVQTGSIALDAGDSLYITVSPSGGHSDITIQYEFRVGDAAAAAYTGGTLSPSTVIAEFRLITQDNVATYRASDARARGWIADAQGQIMRCPNGICERIDTTGASIDIPDTVASTDTLRLGYKWFTPLVSFCVYKFTISMDPNMKNDPQMQSHREIFELATGARMQ